MVSKRSLMTRNGVLRLATRSPKPSVSSVCPFCSLIPSRATDDRPARSRRWKSTSATAIESSSSVASNPRLDLESSLLELRKRMPALCDPSRLQLALQGLRQEPGREAVRVAILGLNHSQGSGKDAARKVLKALLADPLIEKQDWERELDEHDASQPLIVRVEGRNVDGSGSRLEVSKGSRPRELRVSSAVWNGLNLEILLMNVDAPLGGKGLLSAHELEQIALVPTAEMSSAGNRVTSLKTPVHQTLLVADGFKGAVSVSALPTSEIGELVLAAVDLKGLSDDKLESNFVVMDTSLASEGIELFRKGPQHAMEYEDRWSASNIAVLTAWLKASVKTSPKETKPAIRKLVTSVLQSILSTIDSEVEGKIALRNRISKTATPEVQALNENLSAWAQQAHAELQGQLDLAFTERRWRKLGWWKLFWRVDDVAMLANELLSQRFLPTAEQELVYLAGQIAQLKGKGGQYAQPKSLRGESSERAENVDDAALISTIPRRALPKWPGHIAFTRRYLQNETVPALQSLAQKLVLQSVTTSSLTSILAGLLYVSSFSSSVFEAGAVAALGAVYSLGRMQKKWETAREFWEGDIREEGRKAVRAAEESVAEVLNGGREGGLTAQRLGELEEARELVARAKDALARMK